MQAEVLAAPSIDVVALEVEAHVRKVLEHERERWSLVDGWLAEPIDLLADYVLAGGKRLRPSFCRYGYLGAGGDPNARDWLDVAAGLELLHAFALLHDDVMDGSALRRGRPALHRRLEEDHQRGRWRGEPRRFGEGVAVLLGDLAFTCADRLVRTAGSDVAAVWDELRIELMMGQYLDVAGASPRVSADRAGTPHRPVQIGRIQRRAAPAPRCSPRGRTLALIDGYTAFGRPLGEAFQLRDDLLGVFGDEASTGKPAGDDLREGKPTVLLAVARRLAGFHGTRLLARVGAVDLEDDEVDRLRHLLVECGASAGVERMIEERHARALDALQLMELPTPVDERLRELAARAIWRAD